jgi:hypothetical protein
MKPPLKESTMPSVWLLRGVLAAATMLALLAGIPEDYTPSVFVVVVVAVGVVIGMLRPEHLALSVTMGIVIVWWALQLRSEMPVAVLVVAAALIVAHVAATLLAYGPRSLAVDPALAVLWGMRAAMTWTAALAVWVVARAYSGHGSPELFWLAGLAAAAVAAVVGAVAAPIRAKESRG